MRALESESPLIVYVDIKSPYAFVAIRPIQELEARLRLQFDWRPLTLDIPSYLGSAKKKAGKVVESSRTPASWRAVKYAYRDARRYAEQQGYILRGTEKIWDSSIANIGISWVMKEARERLPAYFEAVYPAFWNRELDIEDPAVIQTCLNTAGVDSTGFLEYQQGEGREQHDALQVQLHPAGIYGVPTFVLEQEILFGREHLPYVGWQLGGSEGSAPDIAYSLPQGMTAAPGTDSMDVYLDFKSPQAYLALKPTLELARRREVQINWRPYETRQPLIEPERVDETRGETHVRVRQQQRHATCLKYAGIQGVPMRFSEQPRDTRCALAGLLFCADDPVPYLEVAFRAYWSEGADLDSEEVVQGLLRQAGYNDQDFRAEDYLAELDRHQAQAEEAGVFDTPMYHVAGEWFLGREQMPWIEFLLK